MTLTLPWWAPDERGTATKTRPLSPSEPTHRSKLASSSARSTPSPLDSPLGGTVALPKSSTSRPHSRARTGKVNGSGAGRGGGGGGNGGGGGGREVGEGRSHANSIASGSSAGALGYLASSSSGPDSASEGDEDDQESTASEGEGPRGAAFLKQPRERANRVWRGLTSLTSPSNTPQGSTPFDEADRPLLGDQPFSSPVSGKGRQVLVDRRSHFQPEPPSTTSTHDAPSDDASTSLFPSLAAAVSAAKASASAAYASRIERERHPPHHHARRDDDGASGPAGLSVDSGRPRGRLSPGNRTRDAKDPTRESIDGVAGQEGVGTVPPERPGSPASHLLRHGRKGPVVFRSGSLFEVSLIVTALSLVLWRLTQLPPVNAAVSFASPSTAAAADIPRPLPIPQFLLLAVAVPLVALFRRKHGSYLVPFTDERGYRDVNIEDDGVASALALPMLLAGAVAYDAGLAVIAQPQSGTTDVYGYPGIRGLEELWAAKALNSTVPTSSIRSGLVGLAGRLVFASSQDRTAIETDPDTRIADEILLRAQVLYSARVDLLCFVVLIGLVLLFDLFLANMALRMSLLPRNNTKRFFGSMAKSTFVSTVVYYIVAKGWAGPGMAQGQLSAFEAAAAVFLSQSSTYIITRLARRGFTLGEVSLFGAAGMSLLLEVGRLSIARWSYPSLDPAEKQSAMAIPALFRRATPIIAFQHALIPGIFTIGFTLAPLLLWSRALAQQPTRRRRVQGAPGVPDDKREKARLRRVLATSIYCGALVIIFGVLGGWTGWVLGGGWAEAWVWAVKFAFLGGDGVDGMTRASATPRRWHRLGLILYWLACLTSAVGGWTTHIVRKRRLRVPPSDGGVVNGSSSTVAHQTVQQPAGAKPVAIRDSRRMRADLNWRRKFFHALALLMFVPGIAIDPAFTSLSFSVAFSLLTFAEYARYFAVLPIGAPIHIFFSEFVDNKDSGPVILSHFYLLTGCAGGVWLEGRGIKQMAGVLTLGVGDAIASVIGKRFGRLRWPGSSKTIEGTIAFVISLVITAFFLRLVGAVPRFSMYRFGLASILSGLLEATTNQNDNLVIPLFHWAVLALLRC